jgi:hypothetical protein
MTHVTPNNHKKKDEKWSDISRNETASTVGSGDSPDFKSSEDTVVWMTRTTSDPTSTIFSCAISPRSTFTRTCLCTQLDIPYLSIVPQEASSRFNTKIVRGMILLRNNRFIVNLPCRRSSGSHLPDSPRNAFPFRNVFFIVDTVFFILDTVSPHSYLYKEVIEALLGGDNGNPVPSSLNVELLTGHTPEFHMSPPHPHYSDVNILGGSVFTFDGHRF